MSLLKLTGYILVTCITGFVSLAHADDNQLMRTQACRNSTMVPASFGRCLESSASADRIMAFAEFDELTADKIEACGKNTRIASTFGACLQLASRKELTAGDISGCNSTLSTAQTYYTCLQTSILARLLYSIDSIGTDSSVVGAVR